MRFCFEAGCSDLHIRPSESTFGLEDRYILSVARYSLDNTKLPKHLSSADNAFSNVVHAQTHQHGEFRGSLIFLDATQLDEGKGAVDVACPCFAASGVMVCDLLKEIEQER